MHREGIIEENCEIILRANFESHIWQGITGQLLGEHRVGIARRTSVREASLRRATTE